MIGVQRNGAGGWNERRQRAEVASGGAEEGFGGWKEVRSRLADVTVFGPIPRFGMDQYPSSHRDRVMRSEIKFLVS